MDTTIGQLKVGTRVVLGRYGVRNESPHPIVWLKASPNCDFISEYVLDYLCFDAQEQRANGDLRWYGNPDYTVSNIFMFLNNESEVWYSDAHETDAPPGARSGQWAQYENHYGFLYHFEEHEIESLHIQTYCVNDSEVTSLIRLPLLSDIFGTERLKLFSKKGVRTKATNDLVYGRGYRVGLNDRSYVPFWCMDKDRCYAKYIDRTGKSNYQGASNCSGIRPMCVIAPNTIVEPIEDDVYRVKPYNIEHETFSDEEFLKYLGVAQP